MQCASELDRLIAEYKQLDVKAQPQRAKELLAQAAPLVDRAAAPLKWAAIRSQFADLCEVDEPAAAIAGYRDALSVWDPAEQHDTWVYCHLQLGCLLSTSPPGSAEAEAALVHLEQAVAEHPFVARLLGNLFAFRPLGDPAENWCRRISCLNLALAQTSPAQDLAAWAAISNELALAFQDEPGTDCAGALEKRIALHQTVLAALQAAGAAVQETCLHLATAYLDRVEGAPAANGLAAEACVQQALRAGAASDDGTMTVQLLLLRSRCLIFKQEPPQVESLQAALAVLAQARALAAPRPQAELRASVEKFIALALLELLRLGQRQQLPAFCQACETALSLFAGPTFGSERRKLLQIQADGLLTVDDFAAAGECCAQAVALAEASLAQAETTSGRLERIWELRESAVLLAHCRARLGDLAGAIDALELGKARLWGRPAAAPAAGNEAPPLALNPTGGGHRSAAFCGRPSAHLAELIPLHGALLMPVFAGAQGIVIVASQGENGAKLTSVHLPHFGKARVLALQRGPSAAALGGWLGAYCFRRSDPARFQAEILALGEELRREFWAPVLQHLGALGLAEGAELLLLPQGASASLPMQVAWRMEDGRQSWLNERYALRFAPSLASLARGASLGSAQPGADSEPLTIIAANPDGDLQFDAFEVAWIQGVHPAAQVLVGASATPQAVLAALHNSSQMHLVTHAEFDLDDPLASRLRLSGGNLSVTQLFAHLSQRRPGFIALSACETGVTRVTSLADEFLGFPMALLAAGVQTVLATSWSVDDEASALLMGQFYREQAGPGGTAAQCLRRAQNWLRCLCVAELSALLRDMRDQPGEAGARAAALRASLRGREGDECPFAHPYFWAGFCVLGGP